MKQCIRHITTSDVAQRRAESQAQAVAARRSERGQGATITRKQERKFKSALHEATERGWFEQQVCREAI